MHIFSNKPTCTFQARLETQQQLESLLLSPRERGLGQQRSDGHSKPGLGNPEVTGAAQPLLSRKELFEGWQEN